LETQTAACALVTVQKMDSVILVGKSAVEAATQTRVDGTFTDQRFMDKVVDNTKKRGHALRRLEQKVGRYSGSENFGFWKKSGKGQVGSGNSPKKIVAENKCQLILKASTSAQVTNDYEKYISSGLVSFGKTMASSRPSLGDYELRLNQQTIDEVYAKI